MRAFLESSFGKSLRVEIDPDAALETLYARRDDLSERDTAEYLVAALDELIEEYREKRAVALAGRHEAE
jgi:hypothetical protein